MSRTLAVKKSLPFFLALLPNIACAEIIKCIDHGQVVYRNHSCSRPVENITVPVTLPGTGTGTRDLVVNQPPVLQPKAVKLESASNITPPTSLSVMLKNGSYTVQGSIREVPTNFQIDTGASNTAVSKRIADAGGFVESDCLSMLDVSTANGVVSVCAVSIPEIKFGDFYAYNVQAIIMPNMQPDALLGMDVLQRFNIEQRARTLKISN